MVHHSSPGIYVMFREDNPTNGRKIDISASPLTGDQPVDTSLGWVDLQSFQKKKMTALTLKWELNQMANLGGTLPYFDKSASNIRLYANAGSEPWPDHEMVVPSDFVPNKDNPMIFVVETPQEEDAGDEDDGQYDQYGGGDVDENSYDNNYGNNPVDPYSNFTMRIQCTSDADWSRYAPEAIQGTYPGEILWTDGNLSYGVANYMAYMVVRRSPNTPNGNVIASGRAANNAAYFVLLG